MIGLPLFLSLFAIGIGFAALWVVADVTKKLTMRTHEMVTDTEASMTRMLAQSDKTNRKLESDLFELDHQITKLNQSHKKECARLNALIAENEEIRIKHFKTSRTG